MLGEPDKRVANSSRPGAPHIKLYDIRRVIAAEHGENVFRAPDEPPK